MNLRKQDKYIVAMDLDETLLNSDGKVSEFTINTLNTAKRLNCVLSISTARGLSSCIDIARQIDADYICCQAGNMIADKNFKGVINDI